MSDPGDELTAQLGSFVISTRTSQMSDPGDELSADGDTGAMSAPLISNDFRFLNLAGELRNRVYEQVFTDQAILVPETGLIFNYKHTKGCSNVFECRRQASWKVGTGCILHQEWRKYASLHQKCSNCGQELDLPSGHQICWSCSGSARGLMYTCHQIHSEVLAILSQHTTPFFEQRFSLERYMFSVPSFGHQDMVTSLGLVFRGDKVDSSSVWRLDVPFQLPPGDLARVFPNLSTIKVALKCKAPQETFLKDKISAMNSEHLMTIANQIVEIMGGFDSRSLDIQISGPLVTQGCKYVIEAKTTGTFKRKFFYCPHWLPTLRRFIREQCPRHWYAPHIHQSSNNNPLSFGLVFQPQRTIKYDANKPGYQINEVSD